MTLGNSTALGSQTAEVVPRTRGKHNQYVDGTPEPWDGLSIQPVGSSETHALGTTGTQAWDIYAPPGFPTTSDNVIRWRGLELQVDGELQEWIDEEPGTVEYVGGRLKKWTA